jgi:hypothetical protein
MRLRTRKKKRETYHMSQNAASLAGGISLRRGYSHHQVVQPQGQFVPQVVDAEEFVSSTRIPDYDERHVAGAQNLEAEPRCEDLGNEELVRDFRVRLRRRENCWDVPGGTQFISAMMPVSTNRDLLQNGRPRIQQPVPHQEVIIRRRRREDSGRADGLALHTS